MGWRRVAAAAVFSLGVLGIMPLEAGATGIGFYLGGGISSGEEEATFSTGESTADTENGVLGIGFALDTNVLGRQSIFNYRLQAGYERMNTKGENSVSQDHEVDWNGFVIEQDFGFGGKIGESVRLWGGPCVRLSYHVGSDEFDNDFNVFGLGIGPVIGANFGVGKSAAITVRTGFLINGYAGEYERTSGVSNDYTMSEGRWFVTVGMLFGESLTRSR